MGTDLVRLIYVSRYQQPISAEALAQIEHCASRRNRAHGLTGVLLAFEGFFLQCIEGASDDVQGVFARIERDSRHHSVVLLSVEPIGERHFSEWSMGLLAVSAGGDALVRRFFSAYAQAQSSCAARAGTELLIQLARNARPLARDAANRH